MSSQNINALLGNAADDGDLTTASLNILTGVNINAQMQTALGISVDDVGAADDVILMNLLIDDTGSVSQAVDAIIEGHNLTLDALSDSKQASSILASTSYLYSKRTLFPFVGVKSATKLDRGNYQANGGSTPLYDQSLVMLGTSIAKVAEFSKQGVAARSINLIITDGDDNASRARAADVAKVVNDMINAEKHIVAFYGIKTYGGVAYEQIAQEMGIPKDWIMTSGATASEVRKVMRMFSQSAVRSSQSAASFSKGASFWN